MKLTDSRAFSDTKNIFGALAYAIIMLGIIMLIPLLILPFYPLETYQIPCFAVPGVLSIFCGYLIKVFTGTNYSMTLKRHS